MALRRARPTFDAAKDSPETYGNVGRIVCLRRRRQAVIPRGAVTPRLDHRASPLAGACCSAIELQVQFDLLFFLRRLKAAAFIELEDDI